MTSFTISVGVLAILFALVVLAGSGLAWMALITGDPLTPAQQTFVQVADWTVKTALGAIVGFAGGAGLARRNGAPAALSGN